MHDPDIWEAPDEFRPERFMRDGKLDSTILDPITIAFGSGRRLGGRQCGYLSSGAHIVLEI